MLHFDKCHNLLITYVNVSDIAILNIRGSDYCCIICEISKSEAIQLLQNTDMGHYTFQKQFWRYKCTRNCNFMRKWKIVIFFKRNKTFETTYKNRKSRYKIWWYWNWKTKIAVSNTVCFGKRGFKYFIGYKKPKKIGLYVYLVQK